METVTNTLQNILDTVKGKKPLKEAFSNDSEGTAAIVGIVIMVIIGFSISYGAARLSYCYNVHIGNSTSAAMGWSFLAFWFSGIYYPIYGLFLNPLCSMTAQATTVGGRRAR